MNKKIPEGINLINEDGKCIDSLENYNDAYVCIVTKAKKAEDEERHVGTYANDKMPTYLPNEIGVYCLVPDGEYDWVDWHDITKVIKVIGKSCNLFDFF